LKYGFYKEKLVSITKKGKTGAEEIVAMMERFRNNPPAILGGSKVVTLKDYTLRKETDLVTGTSSELAFPKSDVLQFITEDGCIISARPSGTEPKIKFYCSVNKPLASKSDFDKVNNELEQKVDQIMSDLAV
jgi:phosphoglucomutase